MLAGQECRECKDCGNIFVDDSIGVLGILTAILRGHKCPKCGSSNTKKVNGII